MRPGLPGSQQEPDAVRGQHGEQPVHSQWPAMRLSDFKVALPSAHVRLVAHHCMIRKLLGQLPCSCLVSEGAIGLHGRHRHVCLSSNAGLLGPPLSLLSNALLPCTLS